MAFKYFVLLFLLEVAVEAASGQTFSYPQITRSGKNVHDFVPDGWMILSDVNGDLNKDGTPDIVLVLQHKDSVKLLANKGHYNDTVVTQPRILLILFKVADGYVITQRSNTFILNHDSPNMDDPFDAVEIKKGVLQINFRIFYSWGSWTITNAKYKFGYRDKQFELIGADMYSVHRATHHFSLYSYNFLTRKRELITGNDDKTRKPKWKILANRNLKTLTTFKEPFTWEIEPDEFI